MTKRLPETERDALERRFHEQMVGVFENALRECNYRAARFIQMVSERHGTQAARDLLAKPEIEYGFVKLWECGRLDLTMEALVLKEPWRQLFSEEELTIARRRLADVGYVTEQ